MKLTVCHPACIGALGEGEGRWAFVDSCFSTFERSRVALQGRKAIQLCSAEAFQRLAKCSERDFSSWVDVNLSERPPEMVLLSPLTRNPFYELFAHVVWIRVVADALLEGGSDILVVTRSDGVLRVLEHQANAAGVAFKAIGRCRFTLTAAIRNGKALAKISYNLVQSICRVALARAILGKRHVARVRATDILIDTYLLDGDVLPSGAVRHRYFPGLMDWYLARGHTPAYYPFLFRVPLRSLLSLYRGYRASAQLFLPPELFLRAGDLLTAATSCIRQSMRKFELRSTHLFGADLGKLISANTFCMALEGLQPLLMAKVPLRIAHAGIRPRWLLDWFENQSLDHAAMIGFSGALPECSVIALRQYAFVGGLLSLQVTSREIKDGLAPREQWLGGSAWLTLATEYDEVGHYSVVPSLRYAYIHQTVPLFQEGEDLLVLLTQSLQESLQILGTVGRALPYLKHSFPFLRIKVHPTLDANRLRRLLLAGNAGRETFASLCWESVEMDQALARARMVVSAGTSSALEAVSMGIPVILVGTQVGIQMNPLEIVDRRLWSVVFDDNQFEQTIRTWTPSHPLPREERLAIGKIVKKSCFEPVTEESMERFALIAAPGEDG